MSERILMKFIVGQRVVKEGEDSRFEGEVVAAFVMGLAHRKLPESQPSAGGSVALGRPAKPITGSTRLEPCELSRSEKRGGSRLASGVAINPLAKLGSISCTPRLAREEISIRHQTLFFEGALPLDEHDLKPSSLRLHRVSQRGGLSATGTVDSLGWGCSNTALAGVSDTC